MPDLIGDPGAADVALDQARVALVILDHDDGDVTLLTHLAGPSAVSLAGSETRKVAPWSSADSHVTVPPSR